MSDSTTSHTGKYLTNFTFKFKTDKELIVRQEEIKRIKKKFPDRIPVVCEYFGFKPTDKLKLDRTKFLVPRNMTLSSFMLLLRRRLSVGPAQALFMFSDSGLVRATMTMNELYSEAADVDGYLYLAVRPENAYGTDLSGAI